MRIRESDQLKTVLAMYEQEINQHLSKPNFQKLKTTAKECVDQRIRVRNCENRNERIETRAPAKGKEELVSVERMQGECYPMKAEGQCTRGDACSFGHEKQCEGRAETQEAHRRGISQVKEFEMNNKKCLNFRHFRADEAVRGEHEALLRLSEAETHTGSLLEEQRNQILSEA